MKKILTLAAVLLLALGSGCANWNKNARVLLYPAAEEKGLYGYHVYAGAGSLETKDYKLIVKQVRPGDELGEPRIVTDLLERRYIVLMFAIENRSANKITFNPARTALTTDEFDYQKPLEYPDFYELSEGKNDRAKERDAGEMKGRFYDSTLTVVPGEKTSRMLIYPPLTGSSEKADLLIKDLYIGTDTEEIYFPFAIKAE